MNMRDQKGQLADSIKPGLGLVEYSAARFSGTAARDCMRKGSHQSFRRVASLVSTMTPHGSAPVSSVAKQGDGVLWFRRLTPGCLARGEQGTLAD